MFVDVMKVLNISHVLLMNFFIDLVLNRKEAVSIFIAQGSYLPYFGYFTLWTWTLTFYKIPMRFSMDVEILEYCCISNLLLYCSKTNTAGLTMDAPPDQQRGGLHRP